MCVLFAPFDPLDCSSLRALHKSKQTALNFLKFPFSFSHKIKDYCCSISQSLINFHDSDELFHCTVLHLSIWFRFQSFGSHIPLLWTISFTASFCSILYFLFFFFFIFCQIEFNSFGVTFEGRVLCSYDYHFKYLYSRCLIEDRQQRHVVVEQQNVGVLAGSSSHNVWKQ